MRTLLLLIASAPSLFGAFTYSRTVTMNHGSVAATQSSFPVIVQLDSSNCGTTLETVGNGGHIQNTTTQASGPAVTMPADLIFTSDSAGATKIPWEVESYDAVNGKLVAWVNISSLSSSVDTVIYVFYGDASVTTPQNTGSFIPANVWDANYVGVWHNANNAASTTISDSTANAFTMTGSGNTSGATTAGQVNGALNFTSYTASRARNATLEPANVTVEVWANPTGGQASNAPIVIKAFDTLHSSPFISYGITINSVYQYFMGIGGATKVFNNGTSPSVGTWIHLAFTYDGTTIRSYENGVTKATLAAAGAISYSNGLVFFAVDETAVAASLKIDEVRISNTPRSQTWITTGYTNQNAPLSFSTIGSEMTGAAAKVMVVN